MAYENITTETRGRVGIITLNRPQALNALNSALIAELNQALDGWEADSSIGCILLTGSDKAFAAGADIKEMQAKTYAEAYAEDFIGTWERITKCRKPVIAAVAGFALGGGCEMAMMCDFIIAADTAKFGQPEIKLGVMPGAGRHAAPHTPHRQIESDGPLPHRPHDGRCRGRARGPRVTRRAGCRPHRRGTEVGRGRRFDVAAGCHDDQGERQPRL